MSEPKRQRRTARSNYSGSKAQTLPPGELLSISGSQAPVVTAIAYGADTLIETNITSLSDLINLGTSTVLWVNIDGLGDAELIRQLGVLFNIHHLVLEDILTIHQRAKVDTYGEHFFFVLTMLETGKELYTEQLSIFISDRAVLTFHDGAADCLETVRERLRKGHRQLRNSHVGYLTYSIIDCVVDGYFPILEEYGEKLERLETAIIENPSKHSVSHIHNIKRDLLSMRRAVWPLREAINTIVRDKPPPFSEETVIHLRDCYDHAVQIIDFIETYRELGADLMDVYLSSVSNRMNEVMRVLTIITTIFVPPTFVAGIYGMNFNTAASPYNMPELNWKFGYIFALSMMLMMVIATVALFWYKGWLGALYQTNLTKSKSHNPLHPIAPNAPTATMYPPGGKHFLPTNQTITFGYRSSVGNPEAQSHLATIGTTMGAFSPVSQESSTIQNAQGQQDGSDNSATTSTEESDDQNSPKND